MATLRLVAAFNRGTLRFSLDDPRMVRFTSSLDRVNALAEAAPGFRYRYKGTVAPYPDRPLMIANLSVWDDIVSLKRYTYGGEHGAFFKDRAEFFVDSDEPPLVIWEVEIVEGVLQLEGEEGKPTIADGILMLDRLTREGTASRLLGVRELRMARG